MLDELQRPGALRLEFQPIFRINGVHRSVYALEALTRGPRDTSMERPDVLFEYARRKGEEAAIDQLCINLALQEAATLPGAPRISINRARVDALRRSALPARADRCSGSSRDRAATVDARDRRASLHVGPRGDAPHA